MSKWAVQYTKVGDYYLPNLITAEEEPEIGVWGQPHLRYIKQHRMVLYTNLLTSGKLNTHLTDIDKQAEGLFSRLVMEMAKNKVLKATDQILWVQRLNNIRNRATEIVDVELISV